jgi:hypothetical protein
MIQNPKSMLTFIWNSHIFQVVDPMPCQKERNSRPSMLSSICTEIFARCGVDREVKGCWLCCGQSKATSGNSHESGFFAVWPRKYGCFFVYQLFTFGHEYIGICPKPIHFLIGQKTRKGLAVADYRRTGRSPVLELRQIP